MLSAPPAGLEDGTLGFLNIAALRHGFAMLDRLGGIKVCVGWVGGSYSGCTRPWAAL